MNNGILGVFTSLDFSSLSGILSFGVTGFLVNLGVLDLLGVLLSSGIGCFLRFFGIVG